jgi:hypothetical protein
MKREPLKRDISEYGSSIKIAKSNEYWDKKAIYWIKKFDECEGNAIKILIEELKKSKQSERLK